MGNNAVNPQIVFTDSAGKPRAAGLLYFYINNTTNLASIYSDESLTIPQANPYTLDAYGRVDGDIKYDAELRIKVTNFDGSDQKTYDNVVSVSGVSGGAFTNQYDVSESNPQALTVTIAAGRTMSGETLVSNSQQVTTSITAPSTNPRIDRVIINKATGIYAIVTGTEAASPSAPAITIGHAPAAQILLQVSSSFIADSMITDERVAGNLLSNISTSETLTNKTIVVANNTITTAANGNLTSTELNAALAELQVDIDAGGGDAAVHAALTTGTHGVTGTITGTSDAQTLTNKEIVVANNTVTTAASGNLAATELNAALSELQTDIDTRTLSTELTAHEADTSTHGVATVAGISEVQTLSNKTIVAVSNTITTAASGNLVSTEINAALAELQTDIDTRASDLIAHEADTSTHGVAAVAGLSETQSFANKTIDSSLNTITNIVNADIKAGAAIDASKLADGSVSNTELQYIQSLTANAQTQIDLKAPLAGPTFTGAATVDTLKDSRVTINGGFITSIITTTSVGSSAIPAPSTATFSTGIGYRALLSSTTGGSNTAIGADSLVNNTTGYSNTGVGRDSIRSNVSGYENVGIGEGALASNTGNRNTSIGISSLYFNASGSLNTGLGRKALFSMSSGSNNTGVGNESEASTNSVSNEVTLGNSLIATLRCQVTTITALSDRRDKTDIEEIDKGLDFINELNPVNFTWDMRDGGKKGVKDAGFIAQELQEVQEKLGKLPNLVMSENPEKLEAGYGALLPVIVKAIQELSERIDMINEGENNG